MQIIYATCIDICLTFLLIKYLKYSNFLYKRLFFHLYSLSTYIFFINLLFIYTYLWKWR